MGNEAFDEAGEPAEGVVFVQVTGWIRQGVLPGIGSGIPAGGDGGKLAVRVHVPDVARAGRLAAHNRIWPFRA
jgi:hypothetical protein